MSNNDTIVPFVPRKREVIVEAPTALVSCETKTPKRVNVSFSRELTEPELIQFTYMVENFCLNSTTPKDSA